MKKLFSIKLLSCLLTVVMMFTVFSVVAYAEDNSGKYIKDVYIAYGEKACKTRLRRSISIGRRLTATFN